MRFKPIMALLCWLIAGKLSWYLSLYLETSITYKVVSPSVALVKKVSPFFVQSTLFITSHFTEYLVGASIVAILSYYFEAELGHILLYVLGLIGQPVTLNLTLIMSHSKSNETMSVYAKQVFYQALVSDIVVLPAIVIATAMLLKRKKAKAQHSTRPVG